MAKETTPKQSVACLPTELLLKILRCSHPTTARTIRCSNKHLCSLVTTKDPAWSEAGWRCCHKGIDNCFMWAAQKEHSEIVAHLLHPSFDICDGVKELALSCAASRADAKIVHLLLDAMDNVEVDGLEALCCAPRDGALEIVEMLLDAKVNVEGDLVDWLNPVELAASNGHCEVLRVLLVAGCRLMYDGQILRQAARFGDIELVVWVVREGVEWMVPDLEDALVCAVIENRAEVVQILLAAGASAQGALCTAVSNGNEEMVWLLLSEGADVDWNNGEALCTAAQYERLDIAKVLLKAAADIHVGNDNTLRRGAREARLEVVKFLLALGANPYTFSVQELLSFARDFHVEVVDVLMEARGEGDCLSLLLANNLSFCTEWGPLWDEPPLRHMAAGKRGTELFKVLLNGHLGAVHKAVRSAQKKGRGNVVLQWAADARLDDRGKSRLVNSNIFGGNLGLM